MTFNFPSLASPEKLGYRFDSMHYSAGAQVDECLLSFETYGDGMTQHSREWPISTEMAADCFSSLAAYLLANPDKVDEVSWKLRQNVSIKDIEFAASIVYKEPKEGEREKPRYYSKEERKVTSADKRHDRRYERVESWMTGKPDAIVRLLWQSFFSPLQTFMLNNAVRDWALAGEGRGWSEMPTLGNPDTTDRGTRYQQHKAWELLQSVIVALDSLDNARHRLESWKEDIERAKTAKAEETVAA